MTNKSTLLIKIPFIFSIAIALIVVIWCVYSTTMSNSSTPAIGYLMLPFAAAIVITFSFALTWSIIYIARFCCERLNIVSEQFTTIPLLILAVIILALISFGGGHRIRRQNLLSAASSASVDRNDLETYLTLGISTRDLELLRELALNPQASTVQLSRIYNACKTNVHGDNSEEFLVFYSLAQNDKTLPNELSEMSASSQTAVRAAIAFNVSTPIRTQLKLASDPDIIVRTSLARNPNLPSEILVKLRADSEIVVRDYAEMNWRNRSSGMTPKQ